MMSSLVNYYVTAEAKAYDGNGTVRIRRWSSYVPTRWLAHIVGKLAVNRVANKLIRDVNPRKVYTKYTVR